MMEENEDYDSDSTVLLTDFVNKPKKIDIKRRRLSHYQDSNSGQCINENIAPNENIQAHSSKKDNDKNWRLSKYFSSTNNTSNTDLRSNISDNKANYGKEATQAPDCDFPKGSTAKTDNNGDIIVLDSDDETPSYEKSQNEDKDKVDISSNNDCTHDTQLNVVTPAAINTRRATINEFEQINVHSNAKVSQKLKEYKPARISCLKPSTSIIASRPTTHFEENILKMNPIDAETISKNDNSISEIDKQADNNLCKLITPKLSALQSTSDKNNISSSTNKIIEVCVETQDENQIGKADYDTILKKTAHKRLGNKNESHKKAKRIKMSKYLVDKSEENNEDRRGKSDGQNENKPSAENNARHNNAVLVASTFNKECENRDTNKANVSPDKQESRKQPAEQVRSEGHNKQSINKLLDKEITSNVFDMQETTNTEYVPGTRNDETLANEEQVKQNSNEILNKTIAGEISENQITTQALDDKLALTGTDTILDTTNLTRTTTNEEQNIISKRQGDQVKNGTLDTEDVTITPSKQEQQKASSEQAKTKSSNELETNRQGETSEVSRHVGAEELEDNERVLTFQINFFTLVKEYIVKIYPDFPIVLNNLIQTLINNARTGTFQTDVQYSCPKCGRESSRMLKEVKTDDNKSNADSSQNCGLCRGIKKLHTSYLNRYLNKKDRVVVNKEVMKSPVTEHAKQLADQISVLQEIASSHPPSIPGKNTSNDLASSSAVEDRCINLIVEKKKRAENLSPTQSNSGTKKTNNDVSQIRKTITETPSTKSPENNGEKNESLSVRFSETDTNKYTLIDASDQETTVIRNIETSEEIDPTSCVHDCLSTNNEMSISKKRSNYGMHEQTVTYKREKTTENNNISEINPDQKTKVNSGTQENNNVIEKNQNIGQAVHLLSNNSTDDPSKNAQVTPSIESDHLIYPVVVGSNNEGELTKAMSSNHDDEPIAKDPLNKSKTKIQMNTTNINTQEVCQKSKSDDILAAETDEFKSKSDSNMNETDQIANKDVIGPTNHKASNVEADDSEKTLEIISNNSAIDTIPEGDVTNANTQISGTKETHKDNENMIKALVDCFTQLRKNTKDVECNQANILEQDKTLTSLTSQPSISSEKVLHSAKNTNIKFKYKYICPNCTSVYTYPTRLLRHLKNKHPSEPIKIPEKSIGLQCPFCNMILFKNYNKHVVLCSTGAIENNEIKTGHGTNKKEITISKQNINSKTSESTSVMYHCAVCDITLSTYYAVRQHRRKIHSHELKHKPITKSVQIRINKVLQGEKHGADTKIKKVFDTEEDDSGDQNYDKVNDSNNTSSESEGGSSDTIDTTDITSQSTIHSEEICKSNTNRDTSCNEYEDSCDSDDSTYTLHDSTSETSEEENDEKRDANKIEKLKASKDDLSITSYQSYRTSRHNNYTFKCVLCNKTVFSDYARRRHNQHPDMKDVKIFKKIKHCEPKPSLRDIKNLLKDNSPSRKCVADADVENTSDSDCSTVSDADCVDERSTRAAKCTEMKARSKHHGQQGTRRNKETARSVTVKGTKSKESSDSDWVISTDESADSFDEIEHCDGQNTKIDESTDNQNINLLQNHKDGENQFGNNTSRLSIRETEIPSDDDNIKVTENTIKKRKKRMSILSDDDAETPAQDKQLEENKDTTAKNGASKGVIINEHYQTCHEKSVETPELGKAGNNHENSLNVQHQQDQNKKNCSETSNGDSLTTDSSNTVKVSEENNITASSNAKAKPCDDDRIEIDLIDCLLKEYNVQTLDDQRRCDKTEKDANNDNESIICNDNSGVNIDKTKNGLENIQITNIRSISNKIIIFVCQECSYATDTYDDTIRHCQNHYNDIKDPVNYCNICQINYDKICFERHHISHDKCFTNIKIEFSYQLLFSNWKAIFENTNILLSQAEDIQLKSIYKTFCVKMVVKEDGPWQSALYLCAKCDTCVPPIDVENHVKQSCTLNKYTCGVCDRSFLTHELREHHTIYHTNETVFKTIVFNEKDDDSFNSKLTLVKSQAQNKNTQQNVNIYKCMCGLCFISLKKFKLHFVDCESQTNDGVECEKCSNVRRFLPQDLDVYMSLHHSVLKYEFRVQHITFQQECDYDSSKSDPNLPESTDSTTDNTNETSPTKSELLSQENSVAIENAAHKMSVENDVIIEQDEPFLPTNEQNWQENIDTAKENLGNRVTAQNASEILNEALTIKNDLLNKESLSQNTSSIGNEIESNLNHEGRPENAAGISSNVTDLKIKIDILKDESSSQNITEDKINKTKVIDEDLNIKKERLKDELLSQSTSADCTQENVDVDEDIENKSVENNSTQESMIETNKGIQQDSPNAVRDNLEIEPVLLDDAEAIFIEDSDDDVEFIGVDVNMG